MGLDIYLYRYENREETERLEAEYSKKSEANWNKVGDYDSLTETQKTNLRNEDKAIAKELGLKDDGEDERKECIEIPSSQYPDHYFKVGYFRSSYNGGGINRVLSNLGLPTLYELFNRKDDDEYVWQPDWQMALVRVKDCLTQLQGKANIRCFTVDGQTFRDENNITTEEDAIEKYLEEAERKSSFEEGYSNRFGYFYIKEPLQVHAIINGTRKAFFGEHQTPVTYVIMKGENDWYVQALEIVTETIEYVLTQPDKDKYFLHWSS